MMNRRRFLLSSLAGALAVPLASEAQRAGKVWRVLAVKPWSAMDASGTDLLPWRLLS